MVLQRTFTARFNDYTVTRVYRGTVDAGSAGVKVVDGQMGFHSAATDELSPAIAPHRRRGSRRVRCAGRLCGWMEHNKQFRSALWMCHKVPLYFRCSSCLIVQRGEGDMRILRSAVFTFHAHQEIGIRPPDDTLQARVKILQVTNFYTV